MSSCDGYLLTCRPRRDKGRFRNVYGGPLVRRRSEWEDYEPLIEEVSTSQQVVLSFNHAVVRLEFVTFKSW